METIRMAVCGLDCNGCNLYRAAFDDAAAEGLVDWFKGQGWIGDGGIEELRSKGPLCAGCHGDKASHWSADCTLLACCVDDKKVDNCSRCGSFACKKLEDWAGNSERYQKALNRLRACHNEKEA